MSKCESNTHTTFGIVEGTDFITVVSVGVNNNKTTDTSQTADLSTTNTFKPLNNSHTNSDYVTVLTIGDTNPNDSSNNGNSNNGFREQIDEVLVYRLPGERLGFGLKFEGGTKASEFVRRLYIQSCASDSPASRAESRWGCLIEGDEVLEIDKVPVKRMTRIDCVRCLKDSNMVITLLVRHVESSDELDSTMRQPQVIDSIEKKRAPPPVPPRKVPRKLIKPPEPDSTTKSTTTYKTSTQTSDFKFRGLADGGVIPPDAQVYLDLFSHQESLYSLSESDDTGSSISTVVDRLSSFPTTSASSLAGSLPSTPTAVQRRLDIGAMFDCDREMTALQHESNSDLFAKLANLQAKRAADNNEQQVVGKGKVGNNGNKAAMKSFEALQPPANFQDAPLSYGTEDVRTVETPIKSAILESANPPKECNNNDITSLALTAPRFSLRSNNISSVDTDGSTAVSGDGLPRLVDFVPKHSRVLVVSANDAAANDNVVVVPVEDDAMELADAPHSAYFYEKRDDGTDECCYSDDELDHSDYSDENDSGGGITVLGAFDKWNEMYGVSWKGATQLETIGEVEETPAAVNNVESPLSKNNVEESRPELKTTVHTKQQLKTTEIQLEITKDVLPNDVMSHSPPIYSRQPPDGHEFPDYVETPLSLPTPDNSPPAAITSAVVLPQIPPAVPSNPPPVIPSKPPPALPSKPPPALPSKPPPSIPSSKPPPIVTSRLPPAVPTSTPPTTPPPAKPATNSTQFREKIAMFSSHEEPITLRQASKLSNNCRSSLDISLLQPPGKSSSSFDSTINDSAVTTSEEPFNRPLSSRLHTRSQSLVDISSSGGTSSADRWSQLVEQRKRGMSKLKGLVIPEHSSTFAEISTVSDTPVAAVPVVVDLPEIRSATTGTNLPALTIVSTTTTTAPSHYNNSRVARSPLHLPEPIWKTEQTSGASLAKYSPAFKRKRLQVLDAANAGKTPPSGYDLKSTMELHTKTPPKSLESITSPSQSDCSSFEYNANSTKNTTEKLDDSDNDSAVSSSESRDSCSSPSSNNNEISDESGRLLDPTSVEAINRKNILASAKCRSGKDFKVGSPQLIQRKLSNGELETEGEGVDETVEMRRELVLEDDNLRTIVDLNCPKVIVNETTTVELLINDGDLKAIEESLPEEVANNKTNTEVVETKVIPSEVNGYTIEPEINNSNSFETNLTKETNDLLGKIESVVNIKSTKEIQSLGKEVSSIIRTTSVRNISGTSDNAFDSQIVVKTLERQTSTDKNSLSDRKLSSSSISERRVSSLESNLDLVPILQSTVTHHTESSVVTTPRLQSTVIVTENTVMTTPTLRSTVSVTESSVTTSSKSLSNAAIPESNFSTVKLRETKLSTSNSSNTRSVQLRPVSSPIDRKQSTVTTNKQQHRFSGSNIPLTKGSNKGKTAASSVNDLRKMFQQTSVTGTDNGDVKTPGGNYMTDKSDKSEKRLTTSAAAKFSRLPQAVAPVEGKVGKSSVQHKLGKDEHEALLSRVLAEIGEPLDRKQCKIVILKPELPGGSLGVTLAGGLDYETKEITVHSIRTGSIAFQDGQLQRGDRILSINDRNFKLLTHQQSAAVLKEPVGEFIIVVYQGKGPKTPIAAASPKRASLLFDMPSPTSKEAKPLSKSTLPTTTTATTVASIISDCIEVKLVKDSTSIGFSIAGGFDSPTGDLPVVIKKLFTGGAAEKSGLLRVDDELVAINDVVVTTMTRIDVWNMMKKLPEGLVTLKIRR